jgi:hypothetical protein
MILSQTHPSTKILMIEGLINEIKSKHNFANNKDDSIIFNFDS